MNGISFNHDRSNRSPLGYCTVYHSDSPSAISSDTSFHKPLRYSYPTTTTATQQNSNHPLKTELDNCFQQRRSVRTNLRHDTLVEDRLATSYYDHVRAQVQSHLSNYPRPQPVTHLPSSNRSSQIQPNSNRISFRIEPSSPMISSAISQISRSPSRDPTPNSRLSIKRSVSNPSIPDDQPPLDYSQYTIDSLIQRMIPTEIYKPRITYLYPVLMCSRIHIRPVILLDRLARFTFQSQILIPSDRRGRVLQQLLEILSYWTQTFPYDFRSQEMMTKLDDVLRQIIAHESTLRATAQQMHKNLLSKLKIVDQYEEYIQRINQHMANKPLDAALQTDVLHECPTSNLFAYQVTHIELDRLKSIGAEELLQYYIVKATTEEARVQTERENRSQMSNGSRNRSADAMHEKKPTICLETYIQWSNSLSAFVAAEILKHTQRRTRMQLINYFIQAADECFRLHNFNSMMAILGGLNMKAVSRLKKTWEQVQLETFEKLEEFTDVSQNFRKYRSKLKESLDDVRTQQWMNNRIVIPWMSIVMRDIFFIKTHSQDYTPNGGINLQKYYSIAESISEVFVQCKQSKFTMERNDMIINYILTSPTFDEDSLMRASFECEAAVTKSDKSKFQSLQASTKRN